MALVRGTETVMLYFRKNDWKGVTFFHVECYRKWWDENFVNAFLDWKCKVGPRPKLGRPRTYNNPPAAARLIRLIWYHRKKGNQEYLDKYEAELEAMRVRKPEGV